MISVTLCDQKILVDERHFLSDVLANHGYQGGSFAAAVNQQFVPKQAYGKTSLKEGDIIDIIMPMQGG